MPRLDETRDPFSTEGIAFGEEVLFSGMGESRQAVGRWVTRRGSGLRRCAGLFGRVADHLASWIRAGATGPFFPRSTRRLAGHGLSLLPYDGRDIREGCIEFKIACAAG